MDKTATRPLRKRPLGKRLAWFGGLWAASVAALTLAAGALKLLFNVILR